MLFLPVLLQKQKTVTSPWASTWNQPRIAQKKRKKKRPRGFNYLLKRFVININVLQHGGLAQNWLDLVFSSKSHYSQNKKWKHTLFNFLLLSKQEWCQNVFPCYDLIRNADSRQKRGEELKKPDDCWKVVQNSCQIQMWPAYKIMH